MTKQDLFLECKDNLKEICGDGIPLMLTCSLSGRLVCGPHCFFTPYCHPCQETLQFSYHERNFIHSWVQNPVM